MVIDHCSSTHLDEGIDARGDGALVGEIPGYPALVLGRCPADERRVVDQAVSGGNRGRRGRGEEE